MGSTPKYYSYVSGSPIRCIEHVPLRQLDNARQSPPFGKYDSDQEAPAEGDAKVSGGAKHDENHGRSAVATFGYAACVRQYCTETRETGPVGLRRR